MFESFGQNRCNITINGKKFEARQILLPMPPTENRRLELDYVGTKVFLANKFNSSKRGKRGVLRNSTEYNQWISAAANALKKGRLPKITEPVTVFIECVFPNNRRRDVQNRSKAFFDALTASEHIFEDDCQVELFSMHKTVIKDASFILAYLFPTASLPVTDVKINEDYIKQIAEALKA